MTLVVVQAAGLVTIQDLGRPGHMHDGLALGGALVRALLIAANRAAGNADAAAAIEVFGKLVVRAERDIATSRGLVRAGAELVVESEPLRVAYLAIQGGVDAPLVFGSRATQLSAGIGARLRANDRIATHDRISDARTHGGIPDTARRSPTAARATRDRISDSRPIRVIAGPDFEAFAPDVHAVLVNQTYKVLPSSDRVGTRLVAIDVGARPLPRVANFREASRPMALGAIEVPADGQPIVLGPEHPTTGGYPIVGVVAYDDLDRLFSIRLGDTVRFEVGHVGT